MPRFGLKLKLVFHSQCYCQCCQSNSWYIGGWYLVMTIDDHQHKVSTNDPSSTTPSNDTLQRRNRMIVLVGAATWVPHHGYTW